MKINLISDSALRELKKNIPVNIGRYKEEDSAWIDVFFKNKKNTFISKITDVDVELLLPDSANRKNYDGINAARLHSAFPEITPMIATDERLWATLCHQKFYRYMQARWPLTSLQKSQTEQGVILQRYFFFRPDPRKSTERNGLARLWLSAEMTYDKDRDNPYELTDVMLQNTNFVFHLFGRKFSSNKIILQGTLEAVLMLQKEYGKDVGRIPISEYGRRLNLIGGASLLDLWSKDDAIRNAYDFIRPYM